MVVVGLVDVGDVVSLCTDSGAGGLFEMFKSGCKVRQGHLCRVHCLRDHLVVSSGGLRGFWVGWFVLEVCRYACSFMELRDQEQ